jgi:hypothetical protein
LVDLGRIAFGDPDVLRGGFKRKVPTRFARPGFFICLLGQASFDRAPMKGLEYLRRSRCLTRGLQTKSPDSLRSPGIFHRVAPRSELRSRPNEKSHTSVRDFLFVPRTGFEPAHPCERCDLNTVRLPVSPPGHQVPVQGMQIYGAKANPTNQTDMLKSRSASFRLVLRSVLALR